MQPLEARGQPLEARMTAPAIFRPRVLGAALCGLGAAVTAEPALAGGFSVREQSTTYLGTAFAGAAAGGDISGIFWNSATTGVLPGCNSSSSYSAILGTSDETARSGVFVTAAPGAPRSTDVGSDSVVPASYLTCQLSDKLYAGLALNSQFGLLTKPDDLNWAGAPIAVTSKVFSANLNPTLAYKLTPSLTLGVGLQVEYLRIRLNHASLGPLVGARSFEADDWGVGATAGLLWQPLPGTLLGLGYRSAVGLDVSGSFHRGASLTTTPVATTDVEAGVTLPEQVTFSFRQALAPPWTLLGTVEWTNWSRVGDVAAVASGCGPSRVCEVLNLNYRDGWLFALGAEYAYSPLLTLRTGVAYEISPIRDSTRDILVPDSNRVFLSFGASYRYTQNITVDFAYSHVFFEDAPFCIASPATGSTHCTSGTPPTSVLLRGDADVSVDIVSVGLRYKF
jgi:long-chain fatty acid transport protein